MPPVTGSGWMKPRTPEKAAPPSAEDETREAARREEAARVLALWNSHEPIGEQMPQARSVMWQRDQIERDARRGEYSPAHAERWTQAAGLQAFAVRTEEHIRDLDLTWWPLPLAILWHAWRDRDLTAQAWADFQFWGGLIWQNATNPKQHLSLAQAEFEIFEALGAEKLTATAVYDGSRSEIFHEWWIDIGWEDSNKSMLIMHRRHIEFDDVKIRAHDVKYLHLSAMRIQKTEATVEKNTGGSPTKYDWDGMWIEIMRMSVDGEIQNRSDLTARLSQWFQNTYSKEPSVSEIRKRLKRLYETMNWEQR